MLIDGLSWFDFVQYDELVVFDVIVMLEMICSVVEVGIFILFDFYFFVCYVMSLCMLCEIVQCQCLVLYMVVLVGVKVELLEEFEVLVLCVLLVLFDIKELVGIMCGEVVVWQCEQGCWVEVDGEVVCIIVCNLVGLLVLDVWCIVCKLIYNDGVLGQYDLLELMQLKFELFNCFGLLYFEYVMVSFVDIVGV